MNNPHQADFENSLIQLEISQTTVIERIANLENALQEVMQLNQTLNSENQTQQELINRLNSENQTLNNINQEQQEQITGLSERISHLITQTEKLTKLNKVLLVQMQELEEE